MESQHHWQALMATGALIILTATLCERAMNQTHSYGYVGSAGNNQSQIPKEMNICLGRPRTAILHHMK